MNIPLIPNPQHPSYNFPGLHLRWRLGWLRAQLIYRPYWWFMEALGLGPLVIWGERISFLSSVKVSGPGKIVLGNDTIFDSKPTLFTHTDRAGLRIGDNTFVNGTRFGCALKIIIGRNCILADARIMDTDFHSLHRNRLNPDALVMTQQVNIDDNVWLGAGSAVLKGVHVAQDSVVAFGAIVTKDVPPGRIFAGNPARDLGPVE